MTDLVNDDIRHWAATYTGPAFHALLCDAPYEMAFMGKSWDASGIAFDPQTWRVLAEHLLPGAFCMVFAGTLNDDLISVAMREAGLRKFHRMGAWVFGSGFPKATRIDTQIDKAAGASRDKEWYDRCHDGGTRHNLGDCGQLFPTRGKNGNERELPSTPLARTWAGHRYGGQALKPALESVLIFQKPYEGKPVDCITATGAGALWVDGGRIGTSGSETHRASACGGTIYGKYGEKETVINNCGRWPANLILSHSPDCQQDGDAWRCVDGCAVKAMGEQSGESVSTSGGIGGADSGMWSGKKQALRGGHDDTGTAARYFYNADWNAETEERLENADLVGYYAKASRSEREAGLEGFQQHGPVELYGDGMNTSTRMAPQHTEEGRENRAGNFARNHHPTVKPISLARWLATLLLPPAEYAPRRLLVPFAGVASEMIGAHQAGWDEITGVELSAEYCEIGQARLKHWAAKPAQMELAIK